MSQMQARPIQRVLIASANPLFEKGLEKMLVEHSGKAAPQIRTTTSMAETLSHLEDWKPDLVVVDYDDRTINRAEFLSHFMASDQPMQVMLVSLQASGEVVVYDRRTMTPAQAEDWLSLISNPGGQPQPENSTTRSVDPMRHFAIVGVLVVIFTVLVYWLLSAIGLMPVQAATQAVAVDQMFNVHFVLISFLFSLITVFIGYSMVVFRQKPGEKKFGQYFKSNNRLETVWTIIPLMTVIGLSYYGSVNLAEIRKVDNQAMEVKVTAFQWSWQFEYPDYGITGNTLYLPVNKQVHLVMTSRDVIHSFWVPEFRVKQDVLPGENLVKDLRITPTLIGEYKVRCAELCGGAHAAMERPVIVLSQADFDAWVAKEMSTNIQDPAQRGQKLAEIQCKACHSFDGSTGLGPTWKGLAGHDVDLADGSKVPADDAYLKESITLPAAKIVKGFQNIMPATYKGTLSEQQISDLVAFIKSLK